MSALPKWSIGSGGLLHREGELIVRVNLRNAGAERDLIAQANLAAEFEALASQHVKKCSCGGGGVIHCMLEEYAFGQPAGRYSIDCPSCAEARALLAKAEKLSEL